MVKKRIGIVGAGFAGAVLARLLAEQTEFPVVVFDQRDHVAGNCHTRRDEKTGIMEQVYGAHIFHTSVPGVWRFITRFGKMSNYVHRVKAFTNKGIFGLPINLLTINSFFGKTFSPEEARAFIASRRDKPDGRPPDFEAQALSMVGRELYENFFHGYSLKQWGVEPRHLPAELFNRLPIRYNYDDRYFKNARFQGIPVGGYTALVQNMLSHPNIEVRLNETIRRDAELDFVHLFCSGPIDNWYGYRCGRLGYRTVYWEKHYASNDFQGCPVMNYTPLDVPHTRICEYKHFSPEQTHSGTVVHIEFSKQTEQDDIPCYPIHLPEDLKKFNAYRRLACQEERVSFIGRLGTYRYLDMDRVIQEMMTFAAEAVEGLLGKKKSVPVFSNPENR
jgi:UDP-galactopyranose mutase